MGTAERFRYIDANGREGSLATLQDLVIAVREGTIGESTFLYDERDGRWITAAEHEAYQVAVLTASSEATPGDETTEPPGDRSPEADGAGSGEEPGASNSAAQVGRDAAPTEAAGEPRQTGYEDTPGLAKVTVSSLAVTAAACGLLVILNFVLLDMLSRVSRGDTISASQASFVDGSHQLLSLVVLLAYMTCVVAFCLWFSRKHRNLPALKAADLEYSPGWAAGGFFVPILNLFRPYQVMREVARASSPEVIHPSAWKQVKTPAVVKVWWGLFLVANWLGWASMRAGLSWDESLAALELQTIADLLSNTAFLVAAIVAVRLVRAVEGWQKEKHRRIVNASEPEMQVSSQAGAQFAKAGQDWLYP